MSTTTDWTKEFTATFNSLLGSRSEYDIWEDFIAMTACAISSSIGIDREELYHKSADKYTADELERFGDLLGCVTMALEENPEQDFLGKMYTELGLTSTNKAQFFTPYSIGRFMARKLITEGDMAADIERDGWVSVGDPAVGGGCLLVALANELRKDGINYQEKVLFVGQDLDEKVAMACYIQMSLLGMPGYVKVGDTLKDPVRGYGDNVLLPIGDVWETPMFRTELWTGRRECAALDVYVERTGGWGQVRPVRPEAEGDGQMTLF